MSSPHLCVNLRTLGAHVTGVQRYLLELLPHMPAELRSVKPEGSLQGIRGHVWEQLYLPTQLRNCLLWSPGNTGPLSVRTQVVTVHDAAPLDHPEWFERKFALWYRALLPRLIRQIKATITVSQFSKARIVQLTGVDPERVHVVPNGVNERFFPAGPEEIEKTLEDRHLSAPYLLYVGSIEPRKNLRNLLQAWQLGEFSGATLAVVGATGQVFQQLQFDPLPVGVKMLGRVDDASLRVLYSGAAGFVYPSIYEGFGLPPVEALGCGCPVALSDIPVHRELFDGVAEFFDPQDSRHMADRLEVLLRLDADRRAALAVIGKTRAIQYDWKKAAAATWTILQRTANN